MKNPSQPSCRAAHPVGAEASTRGSPMMLVNSAYCVAVNRLLVRLAMKATNALVPMPPVTLSKATTPERAGRLTPMRASAAKPAVETACSTPKTHRLRWIPSRRMRAPPRTAPATVAHEPKSLTTAPISDLEKPSSR